MGQLRPVWPVAPQKKIKQNSFQVLVPPAGSEVPTPSCLCASAFKEHVFLSLDFFTILIRVFNFIYY